MADQIKIVMADDHPIVRQSLKQVIEADPKLLVFFPLGFSRTWAKAKRLIDFFS